jgi:exosortase/archaeosortase family protein
MRPVTRPVDLWLLLMAALAASQLTLMSRAGTGPGTFTIAAALAWIGGGLLLFERGQEQGLPPAPPRLLLPGLVLLLWCLLVLSFAARLYDPLLHLLPLAALWGLSLVGGAGPATGLFRQLGLIGLIPPAQLFSYVLLPTGFLAGFTAQIAAFLLWLGGQSALAHGIQILLPGRTLEIGPGCTAVISMNLCLAAVVVFALLFPVHSLRLNLALAAGALLIAFLVNAVRVALLGFTLFETGPDWWEQVRGFQFWHDGLGSHLFSLLAMAGTTGLYLASLEWKLQRGRSRG